MRQTKTKIWVTMAIAIVAWMCPQWAQAQFSGSGSGTQNDPYLIFNPIQLNEVRNYLGNSNVWFKMMYDIDLEEWLADNNPTQGWLPIGNATSKFKGHFLGMGHKITGLTINRSTTNYVGFFGCTDGAAISDLIIEGESIEGANYVGGMVGFASATSISNCTVSSDVNASGDYCSICVGYADGVTFNYLKCKGHIVGKNYMGAVAGYCATKNTIISNSSADAYLSGESSIGGFVGYTSADLSISCSNSWGIVNATGDQVGGLVGFSSSKLDIKDSFVNSDIFGQSNTGGLVGKTEKATPSTTHSYGNSPKIVGSYDGDKLLVACRYYKTDNNGVYYRYWEEYYEYCYIYVSINDVKSRGEIFNNYVHGTVKGMNFVGGLIGYSDFHSIKYNYCYCDIKGANNVGGLLGKLSGWNCIYSVLSTSSLLESNVAIVKTVNATSSNVGRVYGSIESNTTIGACGTNTENKGLATAKIILNGILQDLPDNTQFGTNVGNETLKLRATYQGIGWDFSKWQILETESYPYMLGQSAPPVIYGIASGDTVVSGKSANGGMVFITIGDKHYTAETYENKWSVIVDALQAGEQVKAYTICDDLERSYYILQTVSFKGNGTLEEPFEIYTAEELNNINSYSYYRIMNDIDLTEWITNNSSSSGWLPIGLLNGSSMRQLDGNGHKITGLWIDSVDEFCGLIASTQSATICNLSLYTKNGKTVNGMNNVGMIVGKAVNTVFNNVSVNGDIQGLDYVGGLVGYGEGNSYVNCCMSGNVVGYNYTGGLVGYSVDTICASQTEAIVTGNNYVGGLVGQSSSAISECYTTGAVSATNNKTCYAGGITGVNNGSITDCYSNADVSSGVVDGSVANSSLKQYAGGIAGYSYGSIVRCFTSGNLFAVKCGAGIVGYNDGPNAVTSNCFAINDRIDVSNETGIALRVIGGLKNNAPTPTADNYALKTMVVNINNVTQTIYDDLLHGISRPLNALKKASTFSDNGWDMENVWGIDEGESFPYLLALVESDPEPGVLLGDVNGDANINVIDYVTTASYILERNPQPFIFDAADIDKNGTITVNDLVGVASIILSFEAPRLNAPVLGQIDNTSIEMSALICQNENDGQVITISLDNSVDITALQMDITLPQGMTLADASITNRASRSHQIEMEQLRDGTYRLIAASNACKAFKGNYGALLKLTLCGNVPGEVTFTGIELSTPSAQAFTHDDIHLSFGVTSLNSIETDTRIYKEGDNIVILSSIDGSAQVVLPNGISKILKVQAGCNVYPAPVSGVVIVRMDSKAVKLIF